MTAKQITAHDLAELNGFVAAIMDKVAFDPKRFIAEVRRATAGRGAVA